MSNEAVLVTRTEHPTNYLCTDGTGIEKGALLKLADASTVSLSVAEDDIIGGIAAAEKIADNGQTSIAVYRGGRFRMICSGSISVGDQVGTCKDGHPNYVYSQREAITRISGSRTLGTALEDGTAGTNILVEVRPQETDTIIPA